jgi:hypothetical protein
MNLTARALLPIALFSAAAASQTTAIDPNAGKPMFEDNPDSRLRGALLLRHMGSCLYGKERGTARALLRTVPGSKDEERSVAGMRSRLEQCVNGDARAIQFTAFILRGAVAEGIFLAMYPTDPLGTSAAVDRPDLPTSWVQAYGKNPSIGPILALHQLAACVVRAAPAETSRLMRTTPGSAEESAGFQAVAPHFTPCVNQGRSFSSDKTTLRALIAEALYDRFVGVNEDPVSAQ